jgi:sugar lactone lactonase YvrE
MVDFWLRPLVLYRRLIAAILVWSGSLALTAQAQTPSVIEVFKIDTFSQQSSSTSSPSGAVLEAYVQFTTPPADSVAVTLQGPGGPVALQRQSDGSYDNVLNYPSSAAVDAAFPDGTYTVVVSGGTGSQTTVPVTFGTATSQLIVSNYATLQSWPDAEADVILQPAISSDTAVTQSDVYTADGTDVSSLTQTGSQNQVDLTSGTKLPTGVPLTCDIVMVSLTGAYGNGTATEIGVGRGYGIEFGLECIPVPIGFSGVSASQVVRQGTAVEVDATGDFHGDSDRSYSWQWYKDGVALPQGGYTGYPDESIMYSFAAQPSDAGAYTVTTSSEGGPATSPPIWIAVSPTLTTTVIATSSQNGSPANAPFVEPTAVAIDSAGNVYVADQGNLTVCKVTPAGAVSTLAGAPGQSGTADGPGASARFSGFGGIAVDGAGNVYVSDTADTIRRIDGAGNVQTIAGTPVVNPNPFGNPSVDGSQGAAQFTHPSGLTIGPDGNLYVADSAAVRRVTPAGDVTTLAATANLISAAAVCFDPAGNLWFAGSGLAKLDPAGVATVVVPPIPGYQPPQGGLVASAIVAGTRAMACDSAGNLFLCNSQALQLVSPQGVVSMIQPPSGPNYLYDAEGLAISPSGTLYLAGGLNRTLFTATLQPGSGPEITLVGAPRSIAVAVGGSAAFAVAATGPQLNYQWLKNGVPIAGAIYSSLLIPAAAATDAAMYSVQVGNGAGSVTATAVPLSLTSTADLGRIINLSVLTGAGTPSQPLTVGFSIGGTAGATKPVVIRGVGPTLADFSVPSPVPDPEITLFNSSSQALIANRRWGGGSDLIAAFAAVGAFALPASSLDAALLQSLSPGSYSVQVTSVSGTAGEALAELYDSAPGADSAARLENISVLNQAGNGANLLTAGFVIAGSSEQTVLIRGIGPALTAFNVAQPLPDPQLTVYDQQQQIVAVNRFWAGDPALVALFTQVGAFRLADPNSDDAALVVSLQPGSYTVQLGSAGDSIGPALIEVYAVP